MPSSKRSSSSKKKSSEPAALLKYKIQIHPIAYGKHNSVQLRIPCATTPHLIKQMMTGCAPHMPDVNPADTAMAAALIKSLQELSASFKASKNQQLELKYAVSWGSLVISIIMPAPQSTVRQAFKMIKKAISSKLASNAFKMAVAQNKDYKKRRQGIITLINKTLSQANHIHVYTRTPKSLEDRDAKAKKKDQELLEKLHLLLPKELKVEGQAESRKSAIPEQDIYKEMKGFAKLKPEVRQMLVTALQVANLDFFTDESVNRLWVHKEHVQAQYLKLVKQLISARMRFIYKHLINKTKKDEAFNKKLAAMESYVFHQSAALIDVYGQCHSLADVLVARQTLDISEHLSAAFE